ncbi:hypothetical protein Amsp01_044290 [Amycolatopsis sp. NBRC 101858]|nr:hypothetical protein Amsp01_044290 [Amycolatopsis sp. NBRC 101858]
MGSMLELRNRVVSLILALAPFENFDEDAARSITGSLDIALFEVTQSVLGVDATSKGLDLESLDLRWLSVHGEECSSPLARAFGVDSETIPSDAIRFSPGWVLSSYYMRISELLVVLIPHLSSLRLPPVEDVLVGVSAVGWIVGCEDPVSAYCSSDAFLKALYFPAADQTIRPVIRYLEKSEAELRQIQVRIDRSLEVVRKGDDEEAVHLALVDLYKRLVEGQFRRYGWILYCLREGSWSDPPMLTQLREKLVSRGGWLGSIAQRAIIRDIRNGEAHETLIWDGVAEKYQAEGVEVDVSVVTQAAVLVEAFVRGCEAALACYKVMGVEHDFGRPKMGDPGRLSSWQRAEALFGTNGLRLLDAKFNSKTARITCLELEEHQVNPCLQALVICCGLVPHVETFEVRVQSGSDAVITVSAEALRRTLEIWEVALRSLSGMPLSTFLPANFDSRMRSEGVSVASRSIAWIAVDDFLDALDGSAELWRAEDFHLFMARIKVLLLAIESCIEYVPDRAGFRLRLVRDAVIQVKESFESTFVPLLATTLDNEDAVVRMRHWWNVWGPVERLPGIKSKADRSGVFDHRIKLQDAPDDLRWRTM